MEPFGLRRSYYSNKSRGLRKKSGLDDAVPALIDAEVFAKGFRKNWARLIQKILLDRENRGMVITLYGRRYRYA